MSLIKLWQTSPEQLQGKHIHQIIAFAGEGKLRDGSNTSEEFRGFLAQVPSSLLARFVDECLNSSFPDSGFALQDVVNEVGRRLGFKVSNGAYQGRQGHMAHDGLWAFPTKHSVVVEVKTTDAYRIDTGKVAGYRKALAAEGAVSEEISSVLIVVGRQDTGDLEAQIRGSRHAWDIRLISADALLRLMKLKETLDDPTTINRICEVLIPKEYTRLDEIVDLVFSAAEEAKQEETDLDADGTSGDAEEAGETAKPMAFHEACVSRVSLQENITLVRRTRTTYATPDDSARAVCAVSKTHRLQGRESYWFAFHPHQNDFLADRGAKSFLILGCGTPDRVLALSYERMRTWLDDLWVTERDNGQQYWHIRLQAHGGKLWLDRRKGKGKLDVSEYLLPWKAVA